MPQKKKFQSFGWLIHSLPFLKFQLYGVIKIWKYQLFVVSSIDLKFENINSFSKNYDKDMIGIDVVWLGIVYYQMGIRIL